MGIKDYIRIFRRHRLWIIGWIFLITGGYLFYRWFLEEVRFVSTAIFERKSTELQDEIDPADTQDVIARRPGVNLNQLQSSMKQNVVLQRAFIHYLEKARADRKLDFDGPVALGQEPYPVFKNESPEDESNLNELSKCFSVSVNPDTSQFHVTAHSTNKYKVQWILDSVIQAFKENDEEEAKRSLQQIRDKNKQRFEERKEILDTIIEQKKMLTERLKKKYGDQVLWEEGPDRKVAERNNLRSKLDELEGRVIAYRAELKELETYTPDGWTVEGRGGEGKTDELVNDLYKQKELLQQELASLRVDFTDKHPKVIRKMAELNSLNAAFPRLAEEKIQNKIYSVKRMMANDTVSMERTIKDLDRVNRDIQVITEHSLEFKNYQENIGNLKDDIERLSKYIEKIDDAIEGKTGTLVNTTHLPSMGHREKSDGNMIYYVMIFGLVVGLAFAYLLDYMDDTIRTPHDVEKYVGQRVIGTVPLLGKGEEKLLHRVALKSPISEMMNRLAMVLQSWMLRMKGQVLLIASSKPGEGKSTFVTNLAVALCRGGEKVVLIDGDLRKPSLHRFFGIDNSVGFSNFLEDSFGDDVENTDEAKIAKIVHHTDVDGLFIIPSGPIPSNPVGLLKSENVERLLNHLKTYIGTILIDSPPLAMIDAGVLATKVSAVVTVMDAGKVSRREALDGKHLVENVGGNNVGVILNKVTLEGEEYYYYFEGYSYYYGNSRNRKKKPV
ncbi:MAG: polysaccharide biosynthesis tyrosine autokinase [Planctomycetes bacterium]|nr:polysaccharide biosynthesis tyrosine autokinase [Planctomycetota bacterium]